MGVQSLGGEYPQEEEDMEVVSKAEAKAERWDLADWR